ncbi:disease resistance protein, partial [Tanacetum coccineum]
ELPKGLRFMKNLQRLDTGYHNDLQHMPVGIKELTNLRRLSEFVVGKDDGVRIERSFDSEEEVVEGLEPNSGLQELIIVLNFGKLPSLKRIKLYGMKSLKCFHNDDDDAASKDQILFPNLQELIVEFCYSLVSLPSNFPKLRSLEIRVCSKLPSLPDEIQSFKDLNQITIERCELLRRRSEDVDTGEIEDNDDDSVNCRDEDTDENEDKDDDSVISLSTLTRQDSFTRDQRLVAMLNATAVPAKVS